MQIVKLLPNPGYNIPNRKAGPALLQKDSILVASDLFSVLFMYALYMAAAPTGYPPIKPSRSNASVPSGILQIRPIGLNARIFVPKSTSFKIAERKRKGNKEGITARKQISITCSVAMNAVLVSKINRIIAIAVIERATVRPLFIESPQ
jgi:hypothetical protein